MFPSLDLFLVMFISICIIIIIYCRRCGRLMQQRHGEMVFLAGSLLATFDVI